MRVLLVLCALLLVSCASFAPVTSPPLRDIATASVETPWLLPGPAWPIRVSPSGPGELSASGQTTMLKPELPFRQPAALLLPAPVVQAPLLQTLPLQSSPSTPRVSVATLPKPELRPIPVTAATASASAKTTTTPKTNTSNSTTTTVPLTTVPKAPQTTPTANAADSTPAHLLPGAEATNQDFSWQDMNISAGEELSLHFPKTNWLYLDSPAQQKTLGYTSTTRDKEGTSFVFRPINAGQYILEFQRQDLVASSTEVRHIRLKVAPAGTRNSQTGSLQVPQTTTGLSPDALETSRRLAAAGKTAEAVQLLLQNYKDQDTRANLEIAKLLNQDNQEDDALNYLDKNLTLDTPDLRDSMILGTQIAVKDPRKLPNYVKLWLSNPTPPPEAVYLQVLDALKQQKATNLAKDWLKVYDLWYKAPQSRDQYLFLLGNLLEEPGDLLNIKESYKAYSQIIENYPLSPWWKPAGDRASYLNRHFLQVR